MHNNVDTYHEHDRYSIYEEARMKPSSDGKIQPTATRAMKDIALTDIERDPDNRNIDEEDEAFAALVDSVRIFGVLQRLHVRLHGERFQLIDGERRYRAAIAIGLEAVPCEVWPWKVTLIEKSPVRYDSGAVLHETVREADPRVHTRVDPSSPTLTSEVSGARVFPEGVGLISVGKMRLQSGLAAQPASATASNHSPHERYLTCRLYKWHRR
jgi:hypothetical protein